MMAGSRRTHAEEVTETCPNKDAHTPHPRGYLEWHAWAEEMAATYDQTKCPGCGLMAIWKLATEFCSTCQHPVSAHPDMTGDTSCALSECECLEVRP